MTGDLLGEVYEYFLGQFASAEEKGGQFYTPSHVVKTQVAVLLQHQVASDPVVVLEECLFKVNASLKRMVDVLMTSQSMDKRAIPPLGD